MLRVYGQKLFVGIVNSATTLPSSRQKQQNIETSVKIVGAGQTLIIHPKEK